jgi:dCTP deaminase
VLVPDHEIRRLCKQHSMLSPYNEEQLNPASYDVTLGGQIMVEVPTTPELQKVHYMATRRKIHFGFNRVSSSWLKRRRSSTCPNHVGAQFVLKSSRAREGWDHAEAGWADPGWFGSRLTMELRNQRRLHPLPIWPGMRIGQMKFLLVSGRVERSYAETGRYNADLGVTGSKG